MYSIYVEEGLPKEEVDSDELWSLSPVTSCPTEERAANSLSPVQQDSPAASGPPAAVCPAAVSILRNISAPHTHLDLLPGISAYTYLHIKIYI